MISRKLVLQQAKQSGISASSKAVNKAYQNRVNNLPTSTTASAQLNKLGVSMQQVKSNIREQLIINKYITNNSKIDITVNKGEVQQYYNILANKFAQKWYEQ